MKSAIILHGRPSQQEYYSGDFPSPSNAYWLPWLQKQLCMRDIVAQTPEMPLPWKPEYALWQQQFEQCHFTPETSLVGHSCGAGFLVRWLSEHPDIRVGTMVLVAPWLDPERAVTTDFFDFTIDPQLASRAAKLVIFQSDNDQQDVQASIQMIRQAIPDVECRQFHNYYHFRLTEMHTVAFPELLAELADEQPSHA